MAYDKLNDFHFSEIKNVLESRPSYESQIL